MLLAVWLWLRGLLPVPPPLPGVGDDALSRLRADLTDAGALVELAERRAAETADAADDPSVERLLRHALRLAPDDTAIHLAAAALWARAQALDRALAIWDGLLRRNGRLGSALFPLLTLLAEQPRGLRLLTALQRQPPRWWPAWFSRFASQASNVATVRALYQDYPRPVPPPALYAFVDRLQREQRWREAYFVWLDGVSRRGFGALAMLFNGDFERPLSNAGFGWRRRRGDGFSMVAAPRPSGNSRRALRVRFEQPMRGFRHVFQYLMLAPGRYRLSGIVRTQRLRDVAGLHWALHCAPESGDALMTTRKFVGEMNWQLFNTEFVVPERGCSVQLLSLRALDPDETIARGELWFDDMRVKSLDNAF